MAYIDLPPNTSDQGIALAREMAELIGRYFAQDPYAETTSSSKSTDRPNNDPGGSGPFERVCPKCGVGQVGRKHSAKVGSYLVCSNNRYKDDTSTCKWVAFSASDQDDYFAGRKPKIRKPSGDKKPSISASTATATPNREIQAAAALIQAVNSLGPVTKRIAALKPYGFPGGTESYVKWIYEQDSATVNKILEQI